MNLQGISQTLPKISSYGRYANDNYGLNTMQVDLGSLRLYFSYDTIVAYLDDVDGLVVSENAWTVTTGKHLNWIDGGGSAKKDRVPYDEFIQVLRAAIDRHIH